MGLLCVRKAKSGGASRIVSSAAIHNEMLRRRPDLMDVFYDRTVPQLAGRGAAGLSRALSTPIFGFRDGYFTGHVFAGVHTLRAGVSGSAAPHAAADEALDLYAELADELALDMHFEPGDIQLLNNHLIYHGRTQFEDYEEDRKRLLLRLWLSVPGSRPLPQGYEVIYGANEAGAVRGGVPCREGWWRDVTEFRKQRTGIHAREGATW